jgi:transcriptional regulator with XRE-family HTH domain
MSNLEAKPQNGSQPAPLRVFRVAAGLDQRELAALADVSLGTVQNAESGRCKPRRLTIRALAHALGCEPDELFPTEGNGG